MATCAIVVAVAELGGGVIKKLWFENITAIDGSVKSSLETNNNSQREVMAEPAVAMVYTPAGFKHARCC